MTNHRSHIIYRSIFAGNCARDVEKLGKFLDRTINVHDYCYIGSNNWAVLACLETNEETRVKAFFG